MNFYELQKYIYFEIYNSEYVVVSGSGSQVIEPLVVQHVDLAANIKLTLNEMRNTIVIAFFALFAFEHIEVESYKILGIFPTVVPSHYYVGRALMKGLAADGNEVTIVSPFKEKNAIPNYNEIYLDGTYDLIVNGKCKSSFEELTRK